MGSALSEEERRERIRADVKKFKKCPDVKVNRAIVKFCSTSSSNLQQHLSKRKQKSYPTADWLKKLAEKLANLSPDPKLAGLGALAVAVFIDIVSATSSSESTKDALRCVFAEEKASEVWDQIDECLKRCVMNIDDDDAELVSDIKRIECQLSVALTKLKNSMVRDGHMSSQALKAWVNGAAFHIQMLIHLVRLGGIQTCNPVERLLPAYLSDLDLLFRKHKAAVERKCRLDYDILQDDPCPYFESEEGEAYYIIYLEFEEYFEAYYEVHYISQMYEIKKYFRKVRDDLPELASQVGHLSVY